MKDMQDILAVVSALPQPSSSLLTQKLYELTFHEASSRFPDHHAIRVESLTVGDTRTERPFALVSKLQERTLTPLYLTVQTLPGSHWRKYDGEWIEVLSVGDSPLACYANALKHPTTQSR